MTKTYNGPELLPICNKMPTTHFLSSNRELNKHNYYLDTSPYEPFGEPISDSIYNPFRGKALEIYEIHGE